MYRNQRYWVGGVLLVVCCCHGTAKLLVHPRNTSASQGHKVQLNCSTDLLDTPINWQYIAIAHSGEIQEPKDVFFRGELVEPYVNRFQMNASKEEGVYNLVIPSVQLTDTGCYRCRDDNGRGEYAEMILNITENIDLHIEPELAEAEVSTAVQLTCTTYHKTEFVHWQHFPLGNSTPIDVYTNGEFGNDYTSGYVAQSNSTGINILIITSTKLEDSGLFRCIEQEGRGQYKDAKLTVIGKVDCQMFATDICGISPQNVTLVCSMTFHGEFAPLIQWVKAGGDVIDQRVATTYNNDRVTSTLITELDQQRLPINYTCRSVKSGASCKPNSSWNCQTGVDSSSQSYDPKIEPSSTGNNLILLNLLLILLIIPIVFGIVVCCRNKRQKKPVPDSKPKEDASTTLMTKPDA